MVHVDITDLIRTLRRMRTRGVAADKEILAAIGASLLAEVDDHIDSGGSGKWEPFSPATLLRHPRRRGGRLLQDTGLLADFQVDQGDGFVEVFSPAPYARHHVRGTRNMPKRDPTGIDIGKFLEAMADMATEKMA